MKIYYINLATQTGRRADMERQFAALGLAAERVAAVTPDQISAADRAIYCDPQRYLWLTEKEFSCNLSHIEVLRTVARGDDPYALIFEDDVLLSKSLPRFLDAFDQSPPAIDVLKIEAVNAGLRLQPEDPPPTLGGVTLRKAYGWSACAAGYIVSRKAAGFIAEHPDMRGTQVDKALFDSYRDISRRLTIRLTNPSLCIQYDALALSASTSTLQPERDRKAALERQLGLRHWLHELRLHFDRDIYEGTLKTYDQFVRGARKQVVPFNPD